MTFNLNFLQFLLIFILSYIFPRGSAPVSIQHTALMDWVIFPVEANYSTKRTIEKIYIRISIQINV